MTIIAEENLHFIERFYAYNPDMGYSVDSDSSLIEARNSLLHINDNSGFAFRFFDRTRYTLSDGKVFWSKPSNYSGMYYYGRRLTEEELLKVYEAMPYYGHIKSMILCKCGRLITDINEQDMTIEEYVSSFMKQEKPITKALK